MLNAQLQHVMSPSSGLFVAAITTTGRPDSRVTRPSMQVRSWFNVDSACTRCHWHVRSSFQLSCTDEGKQTYMYRDIRKLKKKLKVPMCMLHIHSGLCMKQLYKNDHKISQGTKGFRGVASQKHVYASCEIAWDCRQPSTLSKQKSA